MSGARWWLLGTVAWSAGVLAMNSIASVPWWDTDPLLSDLPETSLTPGQVLLICSIALMASTGLLIGSVRRGESSHRSSLVLAAIALAGVGVILHGLVLVPIVARGADSAVRGDMESLVTGSAWVTALLGGFAVATMKPRDQVLRTVFGVFVMLGTLMVAKALFERFVELPRTITLYESDRQRILLANGIEPGSSRAEIYERRLRSQQPTAWFGLANVLASFLGAMSLLLIVSTCRAVLDARDEQGSSGAAGLLGLSLLATAAALWFTGSLGAIGCTVIVLIPVLVAVRSMKLRDWISAYPGRAIASVGGLVLLGIVGRAIVVPASVERSVLFRWHYLVGTFRVWMENLLVGAGPGGFQDAYTRLKPPVSPENVQSPHVLIADGIGAYGLIGLLVIAGVCFWFWHARPFQPSNEAEQEQPSPEHRGEFACCLLIAASVLTTALIVQWGVVGGVVDLLFVLLLAFGVGAGVLGVLLGVWRRHPASLRWAALGVGAVLIGHGMFDVAPARASSAMLFWLLVGASVGPLRGAAWRHRHWLSGPLLIGLTLAGVIGWAGLRRAIRVEPLLAEAAQATRAEEDDFARSGSLPEGNASARPHRIGDLLSAASQDAGGWLKLDLVRLRLEAQIAATGIGTSDLVSEVDRVGRRWSNSVEAQSSIAATLWAFGGDQQYGAMFRSTAARAAARAAQLAPHDVQPAYRAALMLHEAGYPDQAGQFVQQAVRNLRQTRMDPLAGLDAVQIRYLQREFPDLRPTDFLDPGVPAGGVPGSP